MNTARPTRKVRKYTGRPATLGTMARGSHDLFARCNSCLHQISFGPAEMAAFAERYGP